MEKKYELTGETTVYRYRTLYRIRALKDFNDVKKGDLGGWIENEANLSQEGGCWIYDNAKAYDNGKVVEDACLRENACIHGCASISGNARASVNAVIFESASVFGNAVVLDTARIHGYARVYEYARVLQCARVEGYAGVHGNAQVSGQANILGEADIQTSRDYFTAGPIGSRNDFTTFYKTADGIHVACGCFNGKIKAFENEVKKMHGGTMYEKEYLLAIETAKKVISSSHIVNKYELVDIVCDFGGVTLHRIRALKDFGEVKKNQIGGFVESENNLSQEGTCWIDGDAVVVGCATVSEDARVFGHAIVQDCARIHDHATVSGNANVSDNSEVYEHATVRGHAFLLDNCMVSGHALVSDNAFLSGSSSVHGDATVQGNARLYDLAEVFGNSVVSGFATLIGDAEIRRYNDLFVAGPFVGPELYLTIYRTKEDNLRVDYGGGIFAGGVNVFKEYVDRNYTVNTATILKSIVDAYSKWKQM